MSDFSLHFRLGFLQSINEIAEELAREANAGSYDAQRWLDALIVDKGATPEIVKAIHGVVGNAEFPLRLVLRGKHPAKRRGDLWLELGYGSLEHLSAEQLYAQAAGRFATPDAGKFVARLHRCARKECRRYFVGDPRARWCSETCGSIVRVTKKRRRDKRAKVNQ